VRWGRVGVLVALVATSFVGTRLTVEARSPAECDPNDRVEGEVQGEVPIADQLSGASKQGYACNIRAVANEDFGGIGGDIQLTWSGDCAYMVVPKGTATSDGVGVVRIDPGTGQAVPNSMQVIRLGDWAGKGGGTLGIHEGIHANDVAKILVVPIGNMISVFDISNDCAKPKHRFDMTDDSVDPDPTHADAAGAAGIHSGQLSPDGTQYFATDIGNGAVAPNGPCLTIFDLRTRAIDHWGDDFPCHDLDISPDGTRAFLGYYGAGVGHPAAVVGAFTPVGASHAVSGLRIADISEVTARLQDPKIRILGEITGGRQHTEVYAEQRDEKGNVRKLVLGAEEAYCPNGNGRIVDVTDEDPTKWAQISELRLEINSLPNCGQASYNQNADVLHYMSHYLSVDDPKDARLAFYTWYGSGLRVFDISIPEEPKEVAYFNPPVGEGASRTHDSSTTYPRYFPDSGRIWFGSRANGVNVVELAPHLRPGREHDRWSPQAKQLTGTAVAGAAARAVTNDTPGYCTLLL
jgi:hypothetical protein